MVIFENEGEVNPEVITTFGVSVKDTDSPIGYFGTGLKYALSILLRSGQKVKILSGENVYNFELRPFEVRGKSFDFITMNNEKLPFTTELGKNWEMWQAFRELYCNALDEGGGVRIEDKEPNPEEGKTKVVVEGLDFENICRNKDHIILNLPDNLLVESYGGRLVDVYDTPSQSIFYRGVKVAGLEQESRYTYDIKTQLQLTEDRTLRNDRSAFNRIEEQVLKLTDKTAIFNILTETEYLESDFNFSFLVSDPVSDEFMEVLGREFRYNNDNLNPSARRFYQDKMNKNAAKNYEEAELSVVEKKQLEKCESICREMFSDFDNYNTMVVKSLGQQTLALADQKEKTMVFSRKCFDYGTKFLLARMIEEYAHLSTGYCDLTRDLQTWLFDQMTKLIENNVVQEPL